MPDSSTGAPQPRAPSAPPPGPPPPPCAPPRAPHTPPPRPPTHRPLGPPLRVSPPLLAFLEGPHILGPVASAPPPPLSHLGPDHPPAHVRVQRRQTHPQLRRRLPRRQIAPLPQVTSSESPATPVPYNILICGSRLIG